MTQAVTTVDGQQHVQDHAQLRLETARQPLGARLELIDAADRGPGVGQQRTPDLR